jgi:hypothetical protein
MKLKNILKELEKPEKIYQKPEDEDARVKADLSPEQKAKLFDQGFLVMGSKVINLPQIDQKQKDIIKSKREFDIFKFYPDDNIKRIANEINKTHNTLYKLMDALNKLIELKKSNRI